ncbi:MAG: MFS transporter [Bacteroidota bacterium]
MNYLELLRTYPRYISYGALHYYFSGPGQTFFISLFVPYFLVAAQISQVEFDSIYALGTLASAFTLPWLGSLLDRLKLQHFSLVLGLVYAGVAVLASFVWHPWFLLGVVFGLRLCGQGLMPLTGATATARYFEAVRGKALSLVSFGVSIAEITLPLLIVAAIAAFTWQTTWWLVAGTILLVFVPAILVLVPSKDEFHFNQEGKKAAQGLGGGKSRKEVMRDPYFYGIVLVMMFMPFFTTGIVINKNLLTEAYGWSEAHLAWGLTLFGIARLLVNVLAGPLIDRYSARRVFSYQLIPLGLSCLLLALFPSATMVLVFFTLAGMSSSFNSITSTALWAEIYGTLHFGAIRSLASTIMVFSTALAPVILGYGMEVPDRIPVTLLICAGICLGLLILGLWLTRQVKPFKSEGLRDR